jgi:RNA polymerase sigma-70 factor (ECF subfamily)
MVNNRADAEEVTADVFASLFNHQGFAPTALFKTWLYTIARNRCVDCMRQKFKWSFLSFGRSDEDDVGIDVPDHTLEHGEQLANDEIASLVRKAVQALPQNMREVVVMREYEELSYDEISQVAQISLAQVKVLLHRGREQLKIRLLPLMKEGDHA